MPAQAQTPLATYRLQLNRNFGFADARALVPYLRELGITHLYSSPISAARAGSLHGYDVIDPTRLNPEIGSDEEFDALVSTLQESGMALLLDAVPNHMAASTQNPWWTDVLESGRLSGFAGYFDIDWQPPRPDLKDRVLVPILAHRYGKVLYDGQLSLSFDERGFGVRYFDHRLPVAVETYDQILEPGAEKLLGRLGRRQRTAIAYKNLLARIRRLAGRVAKRPAGTRRYVKERDRIKQALWLLYTDSPPIRRFVERNLRLLNGRRGDSTSFERFDQLLGDQHYRLDYWRLADDESNYRRFFNISDLVSLKIEDPRVFKARQGLLLRFCREGKVAGIRVDHVDGLADPFGYLRRLRRRAGRSIYLVVEKILSGDEELSADWPVAGTTGYDFLNLLNGLFVDAAGCRALGEIYARFTGYPPEFDQVLGERKRRVIGMHFGGELNALGLQLAQLAARDRLARGLPLDELVEALVDVMVSFPVYRTYVRDRTVVTRDRRVIEQALAAAVLRHPSVSRRAFAFLRRVLLLEGMERLPRSERRQRLEFVMRWQQFTGPIMAKGVEDTAFYVYNRLVSLNEVGGDPGSNGVSVEEFHRRMRIRRRRWPLTMNATATHDTKRGEDVRARINLLSEIPDEWERKLRRWGRWNAAERSVVQGRPVPDRNEEILIYQTLFGAWPLAASEMPAFRRRIGAYLLKTAREAKLHTSWLYPNREHEEALVRFVKSISAPRSRTRFLDDFRRFQARYALSGAVNGLAQVVLQIAAPGVPDIYQGTELWNLSLVDPDNRRPVDFGRRVRLLHRLRRDYFVDRDALLRDLLGNWQDGRIKLYLIWRALRFRRARPELFVKGSYVPIAAQGARRRHVSAFIRRRRGDWALVVAPRLVAGLGARSRPPLGSRIWGETTLVLPGNAPEHWYNTLTGETAVARRVAGGRRRLRLDELLARFPVALLAGGGAAG